MRRSTQKLLFIGLISIGITLLVIQKYRLQWIQPRRQPGNDLEYETTLPQSLSTRLKNEVSDEFTEHKNPTAITHKAWFLPNAAEYHTAFKAPPKRLFPEQVDADRILDQLMYVPENYRGYDIPEKTILAYNGLASWWHVKPGPGTFHNCPVNRCSFTENNERAVSADAILYQYDFSSPTSQREYNFVHSAGQRSKNQVYIMFSLESPYNSPTIKFADVFNWTATYRSDSDISIPYDKWTYYDPNVRQKPQQIDYAANKTKKVAWFVSNCNAPNNRLKYAQELSRYIDVDIYGECGPLKCPRSDECYEILDKEYKFYLAFENSNCQEYITEKFYRNGLRHNVLPIVMGARPEDYRRSAPEGSYLHVDEFFGPKELAKYLHRLDKDNRLYNSYFKWKGTGTFIDTYPWCRMCALLHAPITSRYYKDLNDWWRNPGVCVSKSWKN